MATGYSSKNRDGIIGYAFMSPALIVLVMVLLIPLLFNVVISLYDWSLAGDAQRFVGLKNYSDALADDVTIKSLWLTLRFTLVSVSMELVLGFILALVLNSHISGVKFFRLLVLVPFMVSEVVGALAWRFLYHAEFGLLNYFLPLLGLDKQLWLGADLAFISIIIVEIWQHTPFVTIILLAGLQTIPIELQEASRVDGAGFWQELKQITIPLLRPQILIALLFRTIFTMRVFTPIWVLTGGGPANSTLVASINIYRTAFKYLKLGKAAALSWLLFLVALLLAIVYIRSMREEFV